MCKLLESCFDDRILLYDTAKGKNVRITAEVPQGSILRPMLRNTMYDEAALSKGCNIVLFADDIPQVVYGESMEEVELTTLHSISIVENWMRSTYEIETGPSQD